MTAEPSSGDVLLEGLHAVKHALRFGAELRWAITDEPAKLTELAQQLAPDVAGRLAELVTVVDRAEFRAAVVRPSGTPLIALARRPQYSLDELTGRHGRLVALHGARHAGNAGAVIRVAAAAGACGVAFVDGVDPWSPGVVRAAAGLHWAVPVGTASHPVAAGRRLVAFDPDGEAFDPTDVPASAVLAFGSERSGLPPEVLASADLVVRLRMRPGVSSLNLATSVAAALYSLPGTSYTGCPEDR